MKMIRIPALLALVAASSTAAFGEDVIEKVMKDYHKGETALCKKVGKGEASPSELSTMLKAYQDMAKAKPGKGTPASWKEKTDALINAVTAMSKGDKSAVGAYKKAVNCKACHDVHKGH